MCTEKPRRKAVLGVGRGEPMTPNSVLQAGITVSLPKVNGLRKTILKSEVCERREKCISLAA